MPTFCFTGIFHPNPAVVMGEPTASTQQRMTACPCFGGGKALSHPCHLKAADKAASRGFPKAGAVEPPDRRTSRVASLAHHPEDIRFDALAGPDDGAGLSCGTPFLRSVAFRKRSHQFLSVRSGSFEPQVVPERPCIAMGTQKPWREQSESFGKARVQNSQIRNDGGSMIKYLIKLPVATVFFCNDLADEAYAQQELTGGVFELNAPQKAVVLDPVKNVVNFTPECGFSAYPTPVACNTADALLRGSDSRTNRSFGCSCHAAHYLVRM